MKIKHAFMCAAVITASACTSVISDKDEFYFDVPHNESLVEATEFLNLHPDSVEALSQMAEEISLLADSHVESVDEIVEAITKDRPSYNAFIKTLLNNNNVFSLSEEDYCFVMKEISKGIVDAIDLYIYNNANLEY